MASRFPSIKLHITTPAPDGTSSFLTTPPTPSMPIGPQTQLSYIYSTPASFSLDTSSTSISDLLHHQSAPASAPLRSFPAAGGSAALIVDFLPGAGHDQMFAEGFMHRTNSVDYVVVLEGAVEVLLKGGDKVIVNRGEICVGRGPWHATRNASLTENARMLCVAVGGEGAVEGGMEWQEGAMKAMAARGAAAGGAEKK